MSVDFHVWSKGQFTKRKNSTKRPNDTGTIINCYLKDDCGALTPVIVYQPTTTAQNPSDWNYAYIGSFDRYYFVNDWVYNNGLWYAYLSCDVLASYKTQIGASTQYVVRSSATFDTNIVDLLYPTKTNPTNIITTFEDPWLSPTQFSTVLGISAQVTNPGNSIAGINYYAFSSAQLAQFFNNIYSPSELPWWNIEGQIKYDPLSFNPFDFIKSVTIIPLTFGAEPVDIVNFGYWNVPAGARQISAAGSYSGGSGHNITLPTHPQIIRGNFLNSSQFSEHVFILPPFGSFPLDSSKIINNTITYTVSCDLVSGQGRLDIYSGSGETRAHLLYTTTNIGVSALLSSQITTASTQATGLANTIRDLFGMKLEYGNLASAFGAPLVRETGTGGAIADYLETAYPHVSSNFWLIADEYNADRGRPLCKPVQISTIPGYIEATHCELDISCYSSEYDQIINYMESGFFYE